jgi:hypothetical protein
VIVFWNRKPRIIKKCNVNKTVKLIAYCRLSDVQSNVEDVKALTSESAVRKMSHIPTFLSSIKPTQSIKCATLEVLIILGYDAMYIICSYWRFGS